MLYPERRFDDGGTKNRRVTYPMEASVPTETPITHTAANFDQKVRAKMPGTHSPYSTYVQSVMAPGSCRPFPASPLVLTLRGLMKKFHSPTMAMVELIFTNDGNVG